jgi:hypothetical protein
MNHTEKKFLTKTSPMVIDHISSMLDQFPELSIGHHVINVKPRRLSYKDYQLFWRYHGHFKVEFVKAILNVLPDNYSLLSYDHLNNKLTLQVL